MPAKLTYEMVKEYYNNEGWEYLDNEYKGNKHKHLVKCPDGHEQYKRFDSFKNGKRCRICSSKEHSIKRKHDIKSVRQCYSNEEWEYLDNEYKNAKTKHLVKCSESHIQYKRFDSFQQGSRCRICSGKEQSIKQKHTIEYIKEFYNKENWEFLDDVYVDANTYHLVMCKNGHEQYKKFGSFQSGVRCAECSGIKRFTIEYVKEYYENENWKFLDNEYKGIKFNHLVCCPNNHEQYKRFDSFKNGRRCSICWYKSNTGKNHPRFNKDKTRYARTESLRFNLNNISILKEDPNYNDYIINKDKYNIDHIYPRIAFIDYNLDKGIDINIVKEICNSPDNLRIITKEENILKHGKYNQDEFLDWFCQKYEDIINA